MKNLLLILSFLSLNLFGQSVINSYELSYFDTLNTFSVIANNDMFFIDVPSKDSNTEHVNIILEYNELKEFKSIIDSSKNVYNKWSKTAKDNNIKELNKLINFKESITLTVGLFENNKWYFDYDVTLKIRFKIDTEGNYLLVIENDSPLNSNSNTYISSLGFQMIFNSSDEIDSFLSILSIDVVNNALNTYRNNLEDNNTKNDSLFKQ